jgi:hypothetical protein
MWVPECAIHLHVHEKCISTALVDVVGIFRTFKGYLDQCSHMRPGTQHPIPFGHGTIHHNLSFNAEGFGVNDDH